MSLSTDMHDALSELIIGMDEAVAPFRFDKLLYITLPPLSLSKDIVGFKGCWKHSPDGGYWKNEIPKNEDLAVTRELSSTLSALFIDKPLSVSDADKDITIRISKETMSQESMAVKISPREKQVLKGMAAGLNYEKIGDCLGISPFTVRAYSRALGLKLNCNDKTAITLRAMALNLV